MKGVEQEKQNIINRIFGIEQFFKNNGSVVDNFKTVGDS